MQCPVDQTVLVMSDRQGVEIDYCPQCRGVWLDRGELDKIIDRMESSAPAPAPAPAPPPAAPVTQSPPPVNWRDDSDRHPAIDAYGRPVRNWRDDSDEHRAIDAYGRPRKKKKGMLGDLFDF